MKPFVDYIPVNFLKTRLGYRELYELGKAVGFNKLNYAMLTDKKIAVVYGNCQTIWLERIFTLYKEFTDEYLIVEVPKICNYAEFKDIICYLMSDISFWAAVDLFIYQTIRRDNRFSEEMATERVLKFLPPQALKVNIINVYFTGYFPQMYVKQNRILNELHQSGLFPSGDKYVDAMLLGDKEIDLIKSEVLREDFIPEEEIKKAVKESLEELVVREKEVDVKITDYIVKNYSKEQLFYSQNHPIEKVLMEYANRIMEYVGFQRKEISPADIQLTAGTLKGQDIPIYPSVIKTLGLEKYENKFYPNRYMCEDLLLEFEEFLDLYIENYTTSVNHAKQ